ncbi:MAG TPA: DUF1549 and DUF1553 domain-containing protein [Pirellulales bacterium]|jgi:hypothetical protein|nr:DUF1549 and DUF1553 domain-containing protein [Pirellulales bacterium]
MRCTRHWRFAVCASLLLSPLSAAGDEPYGRFQLEPAEREHWAFLPVKPQAVPNVRDASWVRNPIDAFVLARLEAAGLRPAPAADRRTLLRRVYFDLIGLPPTPREQQSFLTDELPDALARLVDSLLARPEYGERWGRHWLDVVRYAESNGYERDGAKPSVWRYRDYVIDSFNRDKPYDQFVREQLAGDELDGSNAPMQIATTFLRLGPWDDEPADPIVDRYDQLDDLVGATSATFLAQTVRCARCHDHKFEVFTQRDYSRLLAVFEPLKRPQDGRTDLDRHVGTPGELADYQAAVKRTEERIATLRKEVNDTESIACRRLIESGMLKLPPAVNMVVPTSQQAAQTWRFTIADPVEGWFSPGFDDSAWQQAPGGFGTAGTPGAVVRTVWNNERIWLRRHFELAGEAALPGELARLRLLAHHDDEVDVYLNGVLAARTAGFTVKYESLAIHSDALAALKPGDNVLAVHCHQTTGGQYIDVGLVSGGDERQAAGAEPLLPGLAIAALKTAPDERTEEDRELAKKYRSRLRQLVATALPDEKGKLDRFEELIQDAQAAPPPEPPRGYVWFEDGPQAPATHVLNRGNPRDPAEEVGPGVPAVLVDAPLGPPQPSGHSTGRRRQLAEWLTRPDNPLVARVMVNRVWQHHFGDGIVGSENDFGVMGEPPSHEELLDWLAGEFVARGWSIKHLHRLMVLSNTYQRSAAVDGSAERGVGSAERGAGSAENGAEGGERSDMSAQAEEKDPHGKLLWRFNARRLEAEAVRDAVLAVSGRLNRQARGPSVYPAISTAVLASQSRPGNGWGKSQPAEAARRSIYIFVKRTLLVPELEVLDFPDTNGPCEQRQVSTVAPQALTLFNGDFMQEQSGHFARRLMAEAGDATSRIELAYGLALSRPPSDGERAAVLEFLARQEEQIRLDAVAGPAGDDAAQQALAAFCLVLLNTNEFVYLR